MTKKEAEFPLKIRHERPMSDLSFKVRAPLKLELASGESVTIDKWSLDGIEFPGNADVLPQKATLAIPFQGVDIQFPVNLSQSDNDRWLTFVDLTGRQRETLAVFYRSILSGRMASTDEVITSLDTPVDLVPMGETEEEESAGKAKQSPRLFRAIWNVTFYIILAFVVFGLVGGQIWTRLTEVNVGQARVQAAMIDHFATEGAYVDQVFVKAGDRVKQGDRLVVLSSPENAGQLNEIRREIRQSEKIVERSEARLARHNREFDVAKSDLASDLNAAIAKRRLGDFLGHYDQGEIQSLLQRIDDFDAGLSEKPGDFHDVRQLLVDAVDADQLALGRLKRRLSAAKTQGGAPDIVAAEDGIISEVAVFEDQFVGRGTFVLSLEEDAPRVAVGWLDERMAAAVHVGMKARVTVNVSGEERQFPGQVVDVLAGVDPDRPGHFGLRVTVVPDLPADVPYETTMRPNNPIELSLIRDWSLGLWGE